MRRYQQVRRNPHGFHCSVLAQAAVKQQLGCLMLPCISETTDDERWHIEHGTTFRSTLKMRFVAPGDWIRVKFDLKPLIRVPVEKCTSL